MTVINYMNALEKIDFISSWIDNYAKSHNISSLVIGISGGIDSAVTSTLCAKTGINTFVVSMPILDHQVLNNRGSNHIKWLKDNFNNIENIDANLSGVFKSFQDTLNNTILNMVLQILKQDSE